MSVFLKRRRLLQSRPRGREGTLPPGALPVPSRTNRAFGSIPLHGGAVMMSGAETGRGVRTCKPLRNLRREGVVPRAGLSPQDAPGNRRRGGKNRTSSLLPDGLWRPPLRTGTKERHRGTRGGSPEGSPRKGKRAPMLLPPSRRAAATVFARGAFLSATGGSVSCPAPRPHGLPLASRPSSASAKTRSISRVKSSGVAKGESENAALTTNDASTT